MFNSGVFFNHNGLLQLGTKEKCTKHCSTFSNTIEFQCVSFVLKKNHILIFLGHTYKTEKQRTESRFKQRGKTDRKDREFINKERKADNIRTTADVVLPLRSGKK